MLSCQAIFIPNLDPCRQGLGVHPVPVANPVLTTAYVCDTCLKRIEESTDTSTS